MFLVDLSSTPSRRLNVPFVLESSKQSGTDRWLTTLACLAPKKRREEWLGDLLEDRADWRSQGRSQLFIIFATIIQLINIMMQNPKLWFVTAGGWALAKFRGWAA